MDENISIESFLVEAPEKLEWLEERCFHRSKKLEQSSSTLATLVYRGEHVAFEFSLDVRDQCIDTEVIKSRMVSFSVIGMAGTRRMSLAIW